MKQKTLISVGFIAVLITIRIMIINIANTKTIYPVEINNYKFQVEVMDSVQKHEKGLSGREYMPQNIGMLFVYDKPVIPGFWMPDMHFAIDIIWIDKNLQIIDSTNDVSPDTFPKKFYPNKPVQYVLEVDDKFLERNKIKIGDYIKFLDDSFIK